MMVSDRVHIDAVKKRLTELGGRPNGLTRADADCTQHVFQVAIMELMLEGALHKSKQGHRTIRYYADKRVADRLSNTKAQGITIIPRVLPKFDKDAPAIITEHTKYTVCPSPSSGQFHVKQFSRW